MKLTISKVLTDEAIDRIADAILVMQEQGDTMTPVLKQQLQQCEAEIRNVMKAIRQGIITETTKECLEDLENQRDSLKASILQLQLERHKFTKEEIVDWISKYKYGNINDLDYRKEIIDAFVNSVFVYDDKLVLTYNYKDGTETLTLQEIESVLSSNLTSMCPPYVKNPNRLVRIFLLVIILQRRMDMLDVMIRNGNVFDSLNGIFQKADVGIVGRKIVKVGSLSCEDAKVEIDAAGMLVTPGLIDGHLHLFTKGSDEGIPADLALLPNGITSAVDGGTAGVSTYDAFHQIDIHNSITSIKSYINISPLGMLHESIFETTDKQFFSRERLADIVDRYRGEIIALKLRYSRDLNENICLDNLDVALEMAEELKLPLVVHVTNPPVDMEEIATKLRPGDVFCHCFQGRGDSIIGADGRVKPTVWEAKRRGVLFDASNGTKNYSHAVAKAAMADGFYPDFITTDGSRVFHSLYKPRCFSLPYLMSKYLALGMPLEEVLKRTTVDVARFAHWDNKGILAEGYDADIAIFKLVDKEIDFADFRDERIHGEKILVPQMTIKGGTIVYRQMDYC